MMHDDRLKSSRKISESCLLVSRQWKLLKPTYFEFKKTPIYIGREIVALKVDESQVNVDFLINELKSEAVHKQLNLYKNKGSINSLDVLDLLKIKIILPSIGEQQAKIRGVLELSQRVKVLLSERNVLAHGQQVKSFDEFASLKHSLGTPRQNILSNVKSLIRFFENNNSNAFIEVKDFYNNRYETNLVDDLIQIKDDINHISTILEKGENGLILNNYNLKPISIHDINMLLNKANTRKEKFTLVYKELKNEEMKGRAIQANITLFQILLDNIFSNANKYAFVDTSNKNEVIIELKVTDENVLLEIKNNGKSFPKNYSKEKFIMKFSTVDPSKGTGLGGYDINRIAEYFSNPDWELDLNENTPFPVSFKFIFPVIPLINE